MRAAAVIFFLIAAFLGQDIAVQSHVHLSSGAAWAEVQANPQTAGKQGLQPDRGPMDISSECPLCRLAAIAGHYLPAASIALPAEREQAFWLYILPLAITPRRQRSHRWRSRAPPR